MIRYIIILLLLLSMPTTIASNKCGNSSFVSSILLSKNHFSLKKFIDDFYNDWKIDLSKNTTYIDNTAIISLDSENTAIAISLINSKVPNNDATIAAQNCAYMWNQAINVSNAHTAHLLVILTSDNLSAIESGIIFTKICSTCLKHDSATAIYTNDAVFSPKMYINSCDSDISNNNIPILNLVSIIYHRNNDGIHIYTNGLKQLNKDEIEIVNSQHQPMELITLVYDIIAYTLNNDIELKDGETLGYSDTEKISITKSASEVYDFKTLKISF